MLDRGALVFLRDEPLSPCGVTARCYECSWEWSLRGVRSLGDIGFPSEG